MMMAAAAMNKKKEGLIRGWVNMPLRRSKLSRGSEVDEVRGSGTTIGT